jgi:hypothetical protein
MLQQWLLHRLWFDCITLSIHRDGLLSPSCPSSISLWPIFAFCTDIYHLFHLCHFHIKPDSSCIKNETHDDGRVSSNRSAYHFIRIYKSNFFSLMSHVTLSSYSIDFCIIPYIFSTDFTVVWFTRLSKATLSPWSFLNIVQGFGSAIALRGSLVNSSYNSHQQEWSNPDCDPKSILGHCKGNSIAHC